MKKFVSILFLIHLNVGFSQNLVANPSFEDFSICPTTAGQLDYATFWNNPTNWGSPDYFNACSQTFGTPSYCYCSSVYQIPVTGLAYTGLWCFDKSVVNSREYIQNQLTSPLDPNICYFVKFYVNQINWAQYGCNNLSLNFSVTQPLLTGSSSLMNLIPHIQIYNNKVIADTVNWQVIQGIYIAGGGENYITIGNFNDDISIDTLKNNSNGSAMGSYYNIDDVSVIEIGNLPGGMPAFAGNDATISQLGDSAFIGQEISNLNCNWSILGGTQIANNTSGLYVQPTATTTYVVEQTLCGTITYDTVTVFVTVGIEEIDLQSIFEIYPNPTTGKVFVSSQRIEDENIKVIVMNITGKEVFNSILSIQNGETDFDLKVESGTYIISIINSSTDEKVIRKIAIVK